MFYHTFIPSFGDWVAVLWHGLRLDVAVAGYLTILPGILLVMSVWTSNNVIAWIWKIYFFMMAFVCSLCYMSNIGLYAYWGFPLDSTPLLYIKTSPNAAMASLSIWQIGLMLCVIILTTIFIYVMIPSIKSGKSFLESSNIRKSFISFVLILLTGILIIPIRGGFSTGTNHTGSVYFSSNIQVNHAAVNPIFSFMESVIHQENISMRYRFVDDAEAYRIFSDLVYTRLRSNAEQHDYNVVLVCLESFSKYIMTEGGHVSGVTPNLDRYSKEGIYFTNFYANSFRTDRGLVSVLSGLPAQPTMSVMDLPRISTSLPSIARTLAKGGYDTHFYYGGDANYSNMRSYIIGTGFDKITAQNDFPTRLSTGKWGVADGPLFDRVIDDIKTSPSSKPFLKVVMTGSSHEPFDVPNYSKLTSSELNAFAYTDECLGRFIEELKKMPCWKNTLVVIVPDHLGAYPQHIDNYQLWRYEIPLVMLGGMIKEARQVPVVGSQIDICATMLAMLGREHDNFPYSKDLFDLDAPHFAFFTIPDAMGMTDGSNFIFYDNISNRVINENGTTVAVSALLLKAKVYLQRLYDELGKREKSQYAQ